MHKVYRPSILLIIGLLLLLNGTVAAQEGAGTLRAGQPAIVTIGAPQTAARLEYTLAENSAVTLQALSESVQPTIAILRQGAVVAQHTNREGTLVATLTVYLSAGEYAVEIGTAAGAAGSVIVVIQSETPIEPVPLPVGTVVSDQVLPQFALALYSFSALAEPAYLFIDGTSPDAGVQVRLLDAESGRVSATLSSAVLGARLRIPPGSASYQLAIAHSGADAVEPFSLCLVPVSMGSCEASVSDSPPVVQEAPATAGCVAMPIFAGGANIRQAPDPNAVILIALPGGATASVLGISPDSTWYNVSYKGFSGWAALSAVAASGNCSGLPFVSPPVVQLAPTAIPPTPMPPPPAETPSGPCVIRFSAPELIYTQPTVDPSYIQDQIPAGGELILVGRWQDWWKTTYYNAWWLNAPGTAGQIMGDCSGIPFITP